MELRNDQAPSWTGRDLKGRSVRALPQPVKTLRAQAKREGLSRHERPSLYSLFAACYQERGAFVRGRSVRGFASFTVTLRPSMAVPLSAWMAA